LWPCAGKCPRGLTSTRFDLGFPYFRLNCLHRPLLTQVSGFILSPSGLMSTVCPPRPIHRRHVGNVIQPNAGGPVPEFDARQSAHTHQPPDRAFAGVQDFSRFLGCHKLRPSFALCVVLRLQTFTSTMYDLLLSAGNTRIGLQDRLNCPIRRWLHSVFTWLLGPPCSKPSPSAFICVICG
jgi:hypothetical protein